MNAFQQTVHIPADRRLELHLTVPDHVPVGKAEMLVVLSPVPEPDQTRAVSPRLGGMRGLGTMDKDLDIKAFEREEVMAMFAGRP